ncbi:hypothetical protein E3E12_08095 [Formicincola oecophyllae]|uniref:Cyanophage baseplate Pam3 plug gp18 domain-containing protein n=1 Tax=Formicincola oecophyllae TaxID=2558361 RepID=A0A4Y6UDB9_9PROT|nr:hypothetical protein E3E12_08095 [Formicincola oecophyllae]
MITIYFEPSQYTAPPFQFSCALAEDNMTVSITWNAAAGRWYFRLQDGSFETLLYRPLIASPVDYDFNLVAGLSASSIVFREATQMFEITP